MTDLFVRVGLRTCLVDFSYRLGARLWKLGEETPPCRIESLEDEEDRGEARQLVIDVEAPRLNNILPVRPRNTRYGPWDIES